MLCVYSAVYTCFMCVFNAGGQRDGSDHRGCRHEERHAACLYKVRHTHTHLLLKVKVMEGMLSVCEEWHCTLVLSASAF